MILDKLENADWYFGCVPGFQQFMKFFNDNDLEELPACKIKLDGQDLIVNISDQVAKDEKDCKLEAHRDYIDIQIPLTASETMLWSSLEDCQDVIKEYDEGKDGAVWRQTRCTVHRAERLLRSVLPHGCAWRRNCIVNVQKDCC